MSRSAQAFAAAENRVDRGRTKERRQAQAEHFAAVARSTADGVLGGYTPELQPEVSEAVIREFCSRLKASKDAPSVTSLLGDICHVLGSDIEGPKAAKFRIANAAFKAGVGE